MKLRTFALWPAGSVPVEAHASGTWLYAVDRGTSATELVKHLGRIGGAVVEVSALAWLDEATVLRDLIRGIGGPNVYAEDWNALRDGLADLPDGVVVIVRDIDPRHERWLGRLVATFDPMTRRAADRAQVLALEGWRHPTVEDVTPTAWKADVYDVAQIPRPKPGPIT